jgi:uncharacterized protein (TIGR03067 family)
MRVRILFVVLLAGLGYAGHAQEAVKKELEKLQGTWKVLKAIKEGDPAPDEKTAKMQVIIAGDKLTLKDGNRDEPTTITIDPGKKPATIDLKVNEKLTIQGIYELDKDALKICFGLEGSKRPAEFASTGQSKTGLLILQREKK